MRFWRFLASSCERAYASQISLMTKQTLFFVCLSFARLLLLPKSTKVSFGVPFPYKTARIRWDCGFLGGFWKILVYASHNFAFEITLSRAITLTLLLVCAFSPRVHSIPRGPLIFARNDVKRVARNKKPTKKHPLGCLNINSPKTARI